ncbi:MAG: hypothetical protein AAF481_15140 [Acidobacteriota bacterium]
MALRGLIKLLILAALLYFGITEVWPWAQAKILNTGSSIAGTATGGDNSAGSACVAEARSASQALADGARAFRSPPYDLAAWSSTVSSVSSRLSRAESACRCDLESCRAGAEAVTELRALLTTFDGMVRGDGSFSNPASQRERADDLLNEAQMLARQGR